jgi:long-chain fatty acid transport protein
MLNPALTGDGDVAFEGDGTAFGWSAGLLYQVSPGFSAGLSYRSAATLDVDGSATYSDLAVMADIKVDGSTELPLPAVTSLGIAYSPMTALQIAFDVNYTQWSAFDTLVLDVDDKYKGTPIGGLVKDTIRDESWEDTWTFRLGAEYMATEALAVRLGAFYDQNPIPDKTMGPFLPDSDRIGVSGGVGYAMGKLSFNLGYLALFFADRTVTNDVLPYPGTDSYTGFTHLVTASASYTF